MSQSTKSGITGSQVRACQALQPTALVVQHFRGPQPSCTLEPRGGSHKYFNAQASLLEILI